MKKILIIIIFVGTSLGCIGQTKGILYSHQIAFDIGSVRNRYLYPITEIQYGSPLLGKTNIRVSFKIRSYGTLYLYSKSAYDLSPLAEYYFSKIPRPIFFSAGIGLDARLRFSRDERSTARSSAEPFICLALHGTYKRLSYHMPLWTRFYNNGISFMLLPEIDYRLGRSVDLFFRDESAYLKVFENSTHEWRHDCFFGVSLFLN